MDDVPSRAAEESRSANLPPATGDQANGEARGIYNKACDFAETFIDIAIGVQSAMPARMDPYDWEDVLQDVALEALREEERDPQYFRKGKPKHWARRAAKNNRRDHGRRHRRRVLLHEAYLRSLATANNLRAKAPDEEYEEQENRDRIAGVFKVLPSDRREAVLDHLEEGLTCAEAATKYGISERIVKRAVETLFRHARLVLADLRPRSSSAPRQSLVVAKPSIVRGTEHDQRS